MSDPALDRFYKLAQSEPGFEMPDGESLKQDPTPAPSFPGNTPPRNSKETLDKEVSSVLGSLPYKKMIVGKERETKKMYTIGALSEALGNKPVTIRSWEAKGWLPKATYRTSKPRGEQVPGKTVQGKRLYSQEQVMFLVKAYNSHILTPAKANWPGFRTYIKRYYPKR